jgi:hypothetical protein
MKTAQMSREEMLSLPVSFDLNQSNRALGLGRTYGYDLAKRGDYPIRVLRIGNKYRVTRADLFRYLGEDDSATQGGGDAA